MLFTKIFSDKRSRTIVVLMDNLSLLLYDVFWLTYLSYTTTLFTPFLPTQPQPNSQNTPPSNHGHQSQHLVAIQEAGNLERWTASPPVEDPRRVNWLFWLKARPVSLGSRCKTSTRTTSSTISTLSLFTRTKQCEGRTYSKSPYPPSHRYVASKC